MDVRAMWSARDLFVEQLTEIDREFEQLRAKKAQLEAIVSNLDNLLKGSEESAPESAVPHRRSQVEVVPVDARASWEIIRDVFPQDGSALTVPQVHKLVNAKETKISNPDAIRIAMRRHPEVFINNGGQYSLRNSSIGGFDFKAEEATEAAS